MNKNTLKSHYCALDLILLFHNEHNQQKEQILKIILFLSTTLPKVKHELRVDLAEKSLKVPWGQVLFVLCTGRRMVRVQAHGL